MQFRTFTFLKGASPSKSRRVSDESITLKPEQTRLEDDGSEGDITVKSVLGGHLRDSCECPRNTGCPLKAGPPEWRR